MAREDLFWSHVDTSAGPGACWPWTASLNNMGYGQVNWKRKNAKAHRVAFELADGPIRSGLIVRHSCDNPRCCNPAHLSLGTMADNTHDMLARGRHPRACALTPERVRLIRLLHVPEAHNQSALARRYGVNSSTVNRILSGESWASV